VTTKITRSFARYIVLPAVSAGILGSAALGLAGMANAGTYPVNDLSPRHSLVATPTVKASPMVMQVSKRWQRSYHLQGVE
jgi:hypothetical protein